MGYDKNNDAKEWERLRLVLERIPYGDITIVMQAGRPVRVELAVKNIKLDGRDDEFEQGLSTVVL